MPFDSTPERTAAEVGRVLGGRYRLLKRVGAGRFTDTYIGVNLSQSSRVAVKLLANECMADGWQQDESLIQGVLQAAEAASGLKHPHLAAIRDWGESDVGPYIVSEFLSGGSLRQMLSSGYLLSPSQTLVVGLEAAQALVEIDRQGLVHGDVRPTNILFDRLGRTRLVDIGILGVLLAAETAGTLCSRPTFLPPEGLRYASPEQAQHLQPDHKSDIYSLVLVLTEALTGRVPFDSADPESTEVFKMSRQLDLAGQFASLGRVLESSVRPERDRRPTGAELAKSLFKVAETLPRPEPLPVPTEDPSAFVPLAGTPHTPPSSSAASGDDLTQDSPKRRGASVRKLMLAVLVVVVVGGFGGGGYWLWSNFFATQHTAVPNLLQVTEADLGAIVAESGWVLERLDVRQDGTTPGEVVRQEPVAGTRLAAGHTLRVFVSLGPELVAIPQNLVGRSLAEAQLALSAVGLEVGQTHAQHHEQVPEGAIVEVDAMFVKVLPASSVDLVISLGPEPRIVPEIAPGVSLAFATERLVETRLAITETQEQSNDIPAGRVVRIEPIAGTQVLADSVVTVVVSSGPVDVAVPALATLTVADAEAVLTDAMLCLGEIDGPSETEVVASDPPAGVTVPSGTCVRLITRP